MDLEDAVKRLDNLTQEEARMALAEVLRITHNVRDDVKVVIEGARGVFSQSPILFDLHTVLSDGKEARVATKDTKSIIQKTANTVEDIQCS